MTIIKVNRPSAEVVAADCQQAAKALDTALLSQARLCASMLEANEQIGLPIATSQRLYKSMTSGMCGIVDNRTHLLSVITQLSSLHRRSNLSPVSFGCPDGVAAPSGSMEEQSLPEKV